MSVGRTTWFDESRVTGHLTCKIVHEMTYNMSSGTLDHTVPIAADSSVVPHTSTVQITISGYPHLHSVDTR